MKLTNFELEEMAERLVPLLEMNNIVGYMAARNYKLIADTVGEYAKIKERLLREYGDPVLDENGNETGTFRISKDDPRFEAFMGDFNEIATYEHEIEFHKVPAERCIDVLTGRQILDIDFMLEYND